MHMGVRPILMNDADESGTRREALDIIPRHPLQPYEPIGTVRGIGAIFQRQDHVTQQLALAMMR